MKPGPLSNLGRSFPPREKHLSPTGNVARRWVASQHFLQNSLEDLLPFPPLSRTLSCNSPLKRPPPQESKEVFIPLHAPPPHFEGRFRSSPSLSKEPSVPKTPFLIGPLTPLRRKSLTFLPLFLTPSSSLLYFRLFLLAGTSDSATSDFPFHLTPSLKSSSSPGTRR